MSWNLTSAIYRFFRQLLQRARRRGTRLIKRTIYRRVKPNKPLFRFRVAQIRNLLVFRRVPIELYRYWTWRSKWKNDTSKHLQIEPAHFATTQVFDDNREKLLIVGIGTRVTLRGCYIRHLVISGTETQIRIEDCVIGNLVFDIGTISGLDIADSCILHITTSSEVATKNPFHGNVLIRDTWLARDPRDHAGRISDLRQIRTHLSSINNFAAAGIFHAAELSLERKHIKRWLSARKFVSWIYEVLSDYGNSISRPLIFLAVFYVVMWLIVFATDNVVTTSGLVGWQTHLCTSRPLRAFAYPILAIFNPVGVFGKPILIAGSWLSSLILTALAFIGTMCVGLMFVGIRRRFKLD